MKKENGKYVAFLRGINVGGSKVIRMEELRKLFEGAGCTDVRTLIQSGNVIFSSTEKDIERLRKRIESHLEQELGYRVETMIRTRESLISMVKKNPFGDLQENQERKLYVGFLYEIPDIRLKLPFIVEKEGLEVLSVEGDHAFIISSRVKGRFGFPNLMIEKVLKVQATSRNWNTVRKLTIDN